MNVVVDTNVLVSGLLNSLGASAEIVRWIAEGQLSLCFNREMLAEYEEVLARPRFDFKPTDVRDLLAQIQTAGLAIEYEPLTERLPDSDDEVFLAAARVAKCHYLIT